MTLPRLENPPGGIFYRGLMEELRRLTDVVAAADAPPWTVQSTTRMIRDARQKLEPYLVPEERAPSGNRPELPARGHPLLPPFVVDVRRTDVVEGHVTLTRAHLGGGAAAHGGVLPLMFDEILGRLVSDGRPSSRTAYLHVDYRAITPLDTELTFRAWIVGEEGRKLFAKGELHHGDRLLVQAEGRFLKLLPGQP